MTAGDTDPRWVGSGWTIFNNKGKPVRQYEPFFSDSHAFEFGVRAGVSPILFYDPPGRVVATIHPNHSWEKVVFDPWQQTTTDVNDTVTLDPAADNDVRGFFVNPDGTPRLRQEEYRPTWHALRTDPAHAAALAARYPDAALRAAETAAATQAAAHADTPTTAHFDALGRPFLTLADNGPDPAQPGQHLRFASRVELDIEGNQREVRDAIVQAGDPLGRAVMRTAYDMLGTRLRQSSMEAGERWTLNDAAGKPIRAFDSRGFARRMTYDALRRPTGLFVTENGAERLAERTVYGEGQGDVANHRGRVYQVFDGAGVVTSDAYDFKGNLLAGRREMLADYQTAANWLNPPPAMLGTFTSRTAYDALNRPTAATTPDGSVYRATFNAANLLERVEVELEGATPATPFVTDIDYDAKGQRQSIAYANGATTTTTYDPLTFRLAALRTTRPAGPNGLGALFANATVVQDLRYTYDAAGNVTRIEDAALPAVFHNNEQVAPVCAYTYDALYRLIEATGREHIAQTGHDFGPPPPGASYRDHPFAGLRANPNDPTALRNYTERYEYDAVGNFTTMRHVAANGSWTRAYTYAEASLLEPAKRSNRLSSTQVGDDHAHPAEAYAHDAHGNVTRLPHLGGAAENLHWDFEDQLQRVALPGGETAYYVYDAAGQRARKVIAAADGTPREERLYLGGYEVYRKHAGADAGLERRTLHVMDDKQRVALVESRNNVNDGTPPRVIRYQLGNHLGSAALELAADAALISYEEYHPYGTTAFQAARGDVEVAAKRYRYTGKERDEETGFAYHGARYYAPWLGRWTACDKDKRSGHRNRYEYVRNNPVNYFDPDGLFEEPVHGATTYRLALAAGFKRDDAAKIALATAGMDHDPSTRPGDSIWEMVTQIFRGRTKELHFASPEKALKDVRADTARGRNMDLTQFGRHLHTLQDVGFKDAPGPHMRAKERLLPALTGAIGGGLLYGGAVALAAGGPVGIAVGLGLLVLGGLFAVFAAFAEGIGHPSYKTEKGSQSHSFSHKADEAYQDPVANTKELRGIYNEMKDAAAAYYGGNATPDDKAAEEAIKGITEADTEDKLRKYMYGKVDQHGNPSTNPNDKSYADIVSEWQKKGGKQFPAPWSKFDATINDEPVLTK